MNVSKLRPEQRERLNRTVSGYPTLFDKLWLCPWRIMPTPDPWQRDALSNVITRHDDVIMCCSRGAGKTETISAAAYVEACLGGFALILSRSDRQALRVFSRVMRYHHKYALVDSLRSTMHELTLENGGRVIALPCSEETIRGEHGVTLLIIDEAARISDNFYAAVTPMTAISKGRLALLSTPYGQRGFFYREWSGRGDSNWQRYQYTWRSCPRITSSHVDKETRRHGSLWVRQEYECEFLSVESGYFNVTEYEDCISDDIDTVELW